MKPVTLGQQVPNWQMMQPDPRLRPHVLCYYLALPPTATPHVLDVPSLPAPPLADGEELLIPDGHSELVFTIDNAFERWAVGQPERRGVMRRSYVIGGRAHSVITRDLGPVTVAGVKLDPRALRWLIGTPLSEFRDSTLTLQELQHPLLLELDDAVAQAASRKGASAEVARVLDGALLHALRDMPAAARPIDSLVGEIRASQGALSILGWIEAHGLSVRQLERDFATNIGMTPKRYARVIRFKHSYHQLIGGTTRPWGAHLDGYYDQSHFNKEFRAFIGAPPTARLAATLRPGTSISDHLLAGELSERASSSTRQLSPPGHSRW